MITDTGKITQQLVDLNRIALSNFTAAAALAQNQTASAVNMTLDQATWLPPEGRQTILHWMDIYQEGCEQFKHYVNDSFHKAEKCFSFEAPSPKAAKNGGKKSPASAKKPSAAKK
jgi:hypothetical protein